MPANAESTQSLYRALLSATPDTVLLLDHNQILGVSVGEAHWLDASELKRQTLDELFTAEQYTEFDEARGMAVSTPGTRVELEVLISPEVIPAWGLSGLKKPAHFEVRLVAIEQGQTLCLIRDKTALRFLEKQSSSNVMRDPLTGLRSHRSLMPVLEKAIGDCKRFEETTFSLILIDIDNFSDLNDRFGWDAGDEVLRALANLLDEQRRSSDYLCRFGDDLFAMLLAETRTEQAMGAGHRVQRLLAELSFSFTEEPLKLTCSVGVATYDSSIDKPNDLLKVVQENVLIANSSGGNEVIGPV